MGKISLNSNIPSSKNRFGYAIVSESKRHYISMNITSAEPTIISYRPVTPSDDSPYFSPPPSHPCRRPIQLAEPFRIQTDHHPPPLTNGSKVLTQGVEQFGEFSWGVQIDMRYQAKPVVLDKRRVMDGVVKK